jgi:polyhydroxyalkanoate synthase
LPHRNTGPRPLPVFLDLLRARTAGKPERMSRALAGLRRYQEAARARAAPVKPAIASRLGASLRDYGGGGPDILFVPSLINPPTVLDLGRRSLLRWLSRQGRRVLLLDWGWPGPERRDLSVAGHVEQILLPLMEELGEPRTWPAIAWAARWQPPPLRSRAPQPDPDRGAVAFLLLRRCESGRTWRACGNRAARLAQQLGVLPMEVLQCAFWSLDPERTVAKFEEFAEADERAARAFVTLEDWANDGPPLSHAAGRELLEDFFGVDAPGRGAWRWRADGRPRLPPLPVLNIVSTTDRIVPAASAAQAASGWSWPAAHVGMVIGSHAREELWKPLASWLSRVSPAC